MSPPLRGQHVAVIGLGKSGLAAVRLLLHAGARVTVQESKTAQAMGTLPAELKHPWVTLRLGEAPSKDVLSKVDLVVVSPGVPLSTPAIQEVRVAGKPVWGEVELAGRFLTSKIPVIGVTGTNGKSTTTALTGELLRAGGFAPFVGGNLGTPLSDAVLAPTPPRAYVVELSSFQLEGTETFHCNSAAVLNLTPDHLDRYSNHAAYGAAKARIFRNQRAGDVAVVNFDDADVLRLAPSPPSRVQGFTTLNKVKGMHELAIGGKGAFSFSFGTRASFTVTNRNLRGKHNLENAMAAALLASSVGTPPDAIQRGLDSYSGLPHRLESVRVLRGVEWINDSKATNVDSTLVALNAFAGSKVWLILGGKGKGAPYEPLKIAGKGSIAGILTIGQDAPTIEKTFSPDFTVHPCSTLDSAVAKAAELAREGDVVLLSPACASYDQFQNFEDRGDTFKRLVQSLS